MGAGRALNNESPSVAFFGITIACVIISQALAYLTSLSGEWPGIVSTCAFLAIGLQWAVFVPSALLATEKFFDMNASFTYMLLTLYSLFKGNTYHVRQLVVTLGVLVWSSRLGVFLYMRTQRTGRDGRFEEIKHNVPRFFNMWTIQGLWVFLTALPVFCLNATESDAEFPSWTDYLGLVCFGLGFACEVIADNQKTAFATQPENQDRWISSGLWAFSRHPNYFGEILLWVGIFLICSTVFSGLQWVAVESPLFVAFLLRKVSGIPLLEARADQKWGHDPEYQAYKASTPELIPWPSSLSFENIMGSSRGHPSATSMAAPDLNEALIEQDEESAAAEDQQPMVETQ